MMNKISVFSINVPDHEDMEQFRVLFQIRQNRDINLWNVEKQVYEEIIVYYVY